MSKQSPKTDRDYEIVDLVDSALTPDENAARVARLLGVSDHVAQNIVDRALGNDPSDLKVSMDGLPPVDNYLDQLALIRSGDSEVGDID